MQKTQKIPRRQKPQYQAGQAKCPLAISGLRKVLRVACIDAHSCPNHSDELLIFGALDPMADYEKISKKLAGEKQVRGYGESARNGEGLWLG
jgi:hypothetical protein